ncbi:MAG: PQQ-binding-like beta-propeller repeat protein [Acidobacteriota bacterium]|nr:PQQ-binding-like beta-propeller repeat protein [Acidobacteriota bacterium]
MRIFRYTLTILSAAGLLLAASSAIAQDVLTYHNDNARTGQNLHETILTPANVNKTEFGKLFVIPVDGKVDAEPLYMAHVPIPGHGNPSVLFVATENDSLYAFDANTGQTLWRARLLKQGETPSDRRHCSQVIPIIGITSTPVIDPKAGPHGTIYAVAMSKDSKGNYFQRLHAIDITNGREEFGGPVDINAEYPGSGAGSKDSRQIFDPKQYEERAGLLLLNHVVYTAWASHCDIDPYTGWVMGYDEHSLRQTSVLDFTPNGSEGSVWQSGAGMAADSAGNIYFLAANGTFDTTLNSAGFPDKGDFGNAFVKLSTAGGKLKVADYFAMYNVVQENDTDEDLGSGGALLIPPMKDDKGRIRYLAVGAGKDRNIYLVNRNNLGKFNPSNNDAIYQELPHALGGREFAMPAYYDGRIYYGSVNDHIRAFNLNHAKLVAQPSSESPESFVYPGATPSVSGDGPANGIVWATGNGSTAVLHAYDAANLAHELYNSNQAGSRDHFGEGNKFITPMIANGKVYVGTTNGVAVFGLLKR